MALISMIRPQPIAFINLGGFVFNQKGDYVSHSVNAW